MQISVRYFASLRETLGKEQEQLNVNQKTTVADVWQQLSEANESIANRSVLCAINQQYASMETVLADGDELAFFPPVTGG